MASKNNYFYVKNASSDGELAISPRVFSDIAIDTVKHLNNVRINKPKTKSHGFSNYTPVVCHINKDNKVTLNVDISIKKGVDIKKTCLHVKDEIESSILLMCEMVPVNININVANIEL